MIVNICIVYFGVFAAFRFYISGYSCLMSLLYIFAYPHLIFVIAYFSVFAPNVFIQHFNVFASNYFRCIFECILIKFSHRVF